MPEYTYIFAVIALLILGGSLGEERPVVKIPNGLVRGSYRTSSGGRQFSAFEGIPYAKPPVGELRFERAVPMEPWSGVWQANSVSQCTQVRHNAQQLNVVEGSEDCLYVHVYTPTLLPEQPLDVVVHIHGGAFMFGSGHVYGPEHLMDRDVVYVTFNYRLGVLGFLSTEDGVVPGNNGLKDQVLALRWVRDNIAYFGGNPDAVTVTGLSAGGASVHLHYLSPLSRGLFQRGISLSGTALCPWVLVEQPLRRAHQLGVAVGCGQRAAADLVQCLRQRPPAQLTLAQRLLQPWLYNPFTPFGPVVEPSATPDAFLPDHPYKLLASGQVQDLPWITSVTSEEGLYPAAEFLFKEDSLPYLEKNWERLAPHILHYDATVAPDDYATVAEKIKEHYLQGKPISRETFPQLVQAVGDRLFAVDADKAARLQARANKAPVYLYRFGYRGDHSISEYYTLGTENLGVSHADDLLYVVSADPSWFSKYLESEGDKTMSKRLTDMWISFAGTGKPKVADVKWKPVSSKARGELRFLRIDTPDNWTMDKVDHLGHLPFWDSLPIKENNRITPEKDEL